MYESAKTLYVQWQERRTATNIARKMAAGIEAYRRCDVQRGATRSRTTIDSDCDVPPPSVQVARLADAHECGATRMASNSLPSVMSKAR